MKAFARLNHGRWIVDCPRKGCNDAYFADHAAEFRCLCTAALACGHSAPCNQIIEPVIPADTDAIDVLVQNRPLDLRNWFPGETVEDLTAENETIGVK